MSTTADSLPTCAFCEKKASYVWSWEQFGPPGVASLATCLSPKCVKQAKGMVLVGETDE
jgi:hypothetical protein